MPEEKNDTTEVTTPNRGHRFEIGHPRYGGRRKSNIQHVRDLADELSIDPMRWMLTLIRDGFTTQVVIENGKRKKVDVVASLEVRTDLAKHVSRFLHPTLSATQVTGANEGPIEVVPASDITRLMLDPAMVDMAQTLALAMIAGPSLPAPQASVVVAPPPKSLPPAPSGPADVDNVLLWHERNSQLK